MSGYKNLSSDKNKLGLTQSDYNKILKYTSKSAFENNIKPAQAKIYGDLIKDTISEPSNKRKGLGYSRE